MLAQELFIKENGEEILEMVKELCNGLMEQSTRVNGRTTMLGVEENSVIQVVIYMRDNG